MQYSWSLSFHGSCKYSIGVKYYSVFCRTCIPNSTLCNDPLKPLNVLSFHLAWLFGFLKYLVTFSLMSLVDSLIWKISIHIFVLSNRLQNWNNASPTHSKSNLKWIHKKKCHLKSRTRGIAIAGKSLANVIPKHCVNGVLFFRALESMSEDNTAKWAAYWWQVTWRVTRWNNTSFPIINMKFMACRAINLLSLGEWGRGEWGFYQNNC